MGALMEKESINLCYGMVLQQDESEEVKRRRKTIIDVFEIQIVFHLLKSRRRWFVVCLLSSIFILFCVLFKYLHLITLKHTKKKRIFHISQFLLTVVTKRCVRNEKVW